MVDLKDIKHFITTSNSDLENLYSDKNLTKKDLCFNDVDKIYTIIKPYIWRGLTLNLPTNKRLSMEDDNSAIYSIGINMVNNVCCPLMLYKILPSKRITSKYDYKIRSFKNIRTITTDSFFDLYTNLNDEEDCINKLLGYNEEYLQLLFMDSFKFGNVNGKQHKVSYYYFKEIKRDSFILIVQMEANSEKANKIIVRNYGIHILDWRMPYNSLISSVQTITLRKKGYLVGDYERTYLGLCTLNDEDVDLIYNPNII